MKDKEKRKKLVLIDGHALIHRAFHALPDLKTKEGKLVNAVYGFSMILLNALADLDPDYVAVSFDLAKPTFRHKEYEEYKGTRKKTSKELSQQIPLVKEVVEALNIPIYEHRGYEADDVIGSLSKQITKKEENIEAVVVTGDLDILQLVDENIFVYTMKKGLTNTIIYDKKKVEQRYGFAPKYLVDYKGLKGDPSDNLPGVEGVGDKTAKQLIDKHGRLEEIYQDLKNGLVDLSDRLKSNLRENKKTAFQSKDLATIRTNIDLDYNLEDMHLNSYNRDKVVKLFSQLEFKSLIDKLPSVDKDDKKKQSAEKIDYQLIKKKKQLEKLIKEIKKEKLVAFDIETETLNGRVIGFSFALGPGSAFYLPIGDKFEIGDVVSVIEDKKIKKIGHGIKYDLRILLDNGYHLKGIYFDTMIAAHLLDPEKRSYKLDGLAFKQLGVEMIPLTDLMGEDHQTPLNEVKVERVKDYSCEDVDMTYRLYEIYRKEIKEKNLKDLLEEIELPLIKILAKMENLGIKLDHNYLKKFQQKVNQQLKQIKSKIYELAGEEFNINSPLQLREILFEKLKINSDDIRKTKTGLSTAASELNKMRGRHQIIDYILDHRRLEKIRNTYIKPLLAKSGRIKTSFNQVITATGRLSSSEPNLQNIPTGSQLGQEVRSAFVAQDGYELVSLDYSQIELRVAAHLSGDKKMIKTFKKGEDIHTSTAAELNGIEIDKVSKEQRDEAKTVNFAVLYGVSPYGLAQSLGKSPEYAKKFINNYFDTFSQVKKYMDKTKEKVRKKGYTRTLLGRKRYFDLGGNSYSAKRLERAAINTPIQGTAADIIKKAMIEIEEELNLAGSLDKDRPRLLLQVHDELIFELPAKKSKDKINKIKRIMEEVIELKVPLLVDVKAGNSWGEMKEL